MKTVLFICVHNSGRSQMAEAFFNQMAKGGARAISAGSQPADRVNPTVAEAMLEEGIDIRWNTPKLLTLAMMNGIDRAITMGCENSCPVTTVQTEDWGLPDPKGKSLQQVREVRGPDKGQSEKTSGEDDSKIGGMTMLEIKKAVIPLDEQDVMALERIITDADEREALRFLKKTVYDQILHSQQGKLKSHFDSANSVQGFIQPNK